MPVCRRKDRRRSWRRSRRASRGDLPRSAAGSASVLILLRRESLVRRLIHEIAELFRIGELDLVEPALTHRVGIDLRRVIGEAGIDRRHFARGRRVNLARRLYRFNDARLLALLDLAANFGQFDEDDVTELALREVGDADRRLIAVDANPLVVFRVANVAHQLLSAGRKVIAMRNERQGCDLRGTRGTAHGEAQPGTGLSERRRDIPHGNRTFERGREAAAGDRADLFAAGIDDRRVAARDLPAFRLDADAAPRRALRELALDDRGTGKAAFLAPPLLDRPGEIGLDRRRAFVNIVAVKAEPGFEPQRIARAKSRRRDLGLREQALRELLGL